MSDWSRVRELRPYGADPPAMPAGGAGKRGYLRLGFEREASGRSVLRQWERRAPMIVQQALYFDEQMPQMPCVYILSSGGPYVDGDRYRQEIHLAPGATARISTGAATKVARMRYNFAALEQQMTLEEGAYLEWVPEPTIPAAHSRLCVRTELTVAPSATLFFAETYLSGRRYHHEERFAYDLLSLALQVRRPNRAMLYREKQLVRPHLFSPARLGVMGTYEVFANLLILLPEEPMQALRADLKPFRDEERGVALSVLTLPEGGGFCCRVLGRSSEAVKREVWRIGSRVRYGVQGKMWPEEFPWR